MSHGIGNVEWPHIFLIYLLISKSIEKKYWEKIKLTKSIEKSFLIDPLITNNAIYRNFNKLPTSTALTQSLSLYIKMVFSNKKQTKLYKLCRRSKTMVGIPLN